MSVRSHALRLYVARERLEATVAFYEQPQGRACERRLVLAGRIEVAVVGAVIVLAGTDEALAPVREARAVFFVDALDATLDVLLENDVEVLHPPQPAAGGRNALARHPDGLVVEYFEPAAPR